MEAKDVHALLKRWGFDLRDGWYCDGKNLDLLEPDEILRRLETTDGMTFVERQPACSGAG